MSKIFRSGSGIRFENVRFQDLESIRLGNTPLFVPKVLAERIIDEEPGSDPDTPKDIADEEVEVEVESQAPSVDVEAIKKEAYTEGKTAGFLQAEKKLHSAVQAFGDGLEKIDRLRRSILEKSKEDMVRLVMAIAEKIVRTEIEEKKDIVVNTVKMAISAAIQADEYHIRVNPEDLGTVAENEPLFLASMKGLRHICFIADKTVSRGGCLAESNAGDVDATIETQLEEIYQQLRKDAN